MLPLSEDELALVTSAATSQGVTDLVEQVREWLTQGHYASKNVWKAYGQSTVR